MEMSAEERCSQEAVWVLRKQDDSYQPVALSAKEASDFQILDANKEFNVASKSQENRLSLSWEGALGSKELWHRFLIISAINIFELSVDNINLLLDGQPRNNLQHHRPLNDVQVW